MSNELYLRKEIEQQDAKDQEQDDILDNRIVKWQRKEFVGPTNDNGIKIQFNNLEIGKTYKITGEARIGNSDATKNKVTFNNGSTFLMQIEYDNPANSFGNIEAGNSIVFVADDTVLTVNAENFNSIASRTLFSAAAILEELPYHEETTQWT